MTDTGLVAPREAAVRLATSTAALAQMRYLGTGPAYVKAGARKIMYRQEDLEAWIAARVVTPSETSEQ